jgi:hypothetical protein
MSNEHNATSTRFSLIELDLPEGETVFEAPPEPAPVVAAEPTKEDEEAALIAKRGESGYFGPGVSKVGAERATEDEAIAEANGFAVAPPIYEIGSLVNQWGVDNFRASRNEFEAMPTVEDACGKLIAEVTNEHRVDIKVPLTELRMNPEGTLTRGTGNGMKLDDRAINGVGSQVTPGGAAYLRKCPPDLRAVNFNHWAESRGTREDVRASRAAQSAWEARGCKGAQPSPVVVPREVNMRTRMQHTPDGSRERVCYSIVSPKYAVHDIDTIAEQVMRSQAIPADARASVTYDGFKSRIDVLFHSNVQPEKVVAGEIFKAGIMLKTADDGSGSIQIAAQVFRNLCLNLIIIDHCKQSVVRQRHLGADIGLAVEKGIAQAMTKVAAFADKWSEATLENVLDKYGVADIEAVMRGLVFNKVVSAPGCDQGAMFTRLMDAYEAEVALAPEQRYSRSIIVNSVTRAAHANTWSKWEAVEELETTGGQLLYQPVWKVAVPEDAGLSY